MDKQKTKLGARVLSEAELEAILPNANKIYEQIEVFRHDSANMDKKQQKINNIGIMGCRGAGKTSILRTFYKTLEEKNKEGDIILPIIVPENMSPDASLMDVILGMFQNIVKDRQKVNKNPNRGDCIYRGRDPLEKAYSELVKQYCYIKKDYRDILIRQFTTEQYYVDKTKEVFNSDTEFIEKFSEFVDQVLAKEKDSQKAMIFLFIDDIDLSTTRCMDVVRTLLSYLSNPRIVTFISGDIENFEEALTLEFLRQEQALCVDVFEKTYYSVTEDNESSRLLERKKSLAYEYLKKIIPPAYRRHIKYWSLEERGDYQIADEHMKTQKSLAELLAGLEGEMLPKAYFMFQGENQKVNYMGAAFHLFDHTSRGLNNVYNVLQELNVSKVDNDKESEKVDSETQKSDQTNSDPQEENLAKWRLIETIVDSNPFYAKYRERLLQQIILQVKKQVKVDFLSLINWLYRDRCNAPQSEKKKQQEERQSEKKEQQEKEVRGFSPEEKFSIFLLADFAARLFSPQDLENDSYQRLKQWIIGEYLSNESIDGKIAPQRVWIDLQKVEKEKKYTVEAALLSFLVQGDFIFDLYLIHYLGREEIYRILRVNGKRYFNTKVNEELYKLAYALAKTVSTINENEEQIKSYLANLYLKMEKTLLNLLDELPLQPEVIYGEQLFRELWSLTQEFMYSEDKTNLAANYYYSLDEYISKANDEMQQHRESYRLWANYTIKYVFYWIYFEWYMRERKEDQIKFDLMEKTRTLFGRGMAKALMKRMREIMDKSQVKALSTENYGSFEGKDDRMQRQVIVQIDKHKMWNCQYVADKVFPYLRKKTEDCQEWIARGRQIFDVSAVVEGAYIKFKQCPKGSSGIALAYDLMKRLDKIMFLSNKDKFADGKYYMRLEHVLTIQCMLEEFLQIHSRIRYGKQEIRRLLKELKELPLVIRTLEWHKIEQELEQREEQFFKEIEDSLKDKMTRKLTEQEKLEQEVDKIYEQCYLEKKAIERFWGEPSYIKKYMKEDYEIKDIGINDSNYLCYLVEKKAVEQLNGGQQPTEEDWKQIEKTVEWEDVKFYFHSYLRYLQANGGSTDNIYAHAEEIVALVNYLMDSEIIADQRLQNQIFEVVSRELELTEEQFQDLF